VRAAVEQVRVSLVVLLVVRMAAAEAAALVQARVAQVARPA